MKLGRYPEAVEDYSKALDLAADADVYQHRGWAHFFSEAWKLALRDFSKALELDPRSSDACTGRGLALVMLGDYRQAVADAERAWRLGPRTPEMMHNLACIFAQAAQAEGEDRHRRRALQALRRSLTMVRPQERSSFWRDKVLPDEALAPIRSDPAFKRLEAEHGHRR
jgi:tetratricopeptide (TPR) repeat protein